jgi:hypothetical protein
MVWALEYKSNDSWGMNFCVGQLKIILWTIFRLVNIATSAHHPFCTNFCQAHCVASSKTLTANMSKRKFSTDSDNRLSMLVSSMTEAQIAELQHVQNGNSCLAPVLEAIRQVYGAAAPPPRTPVKVRNYSTFYSY